MQAAPAAPLRALAGPAYFTPSTAAGKGLRPTQSVVA